MLRLALYTFLSILKNFGEDIVAGLDLVGTGLSAGSANFLQHWLVGHHFFNAHCKVLNVKEILLGVLQVRFQDLCAVLA